MRYLIIDTFNGEGYSDSGIIEDVTYEDISAEEAKYNALTKVREEFVSRYFPCADDEQVRVTYDFDAFFADVGEDSGAIHFKKVEANHYGLIIRPDINEVTLLTRQGFIEHYDAMLDAMQGDRDERLQFIDEMFDIGNAGAHTDLGFEILYKL